MKSELLQITQEIAACRKRHEAVVFLRDNKLVKPFFQRIIADGSQIHLKVELLLDAVFRKEVSLVGWRTDKRAGPALAGSKAEREKGGI